MEAVDSKEVVLDQAQRMFKFGRFTGEEDPTLQGMKKKFVELGGDAKEFPTFKCQ